MKIFQSLENLIFEIFASLVLWPKTLYLVLTKPVKTIRLMDEEMERKGEFRFNKIMSPVFFALLPIITLVYIFQLITPKFEPMEIIDNWYSKTETREKDESELAVVKIGHKTYEVSNYSIVSPQAQPEADQKTADKFHRLDNESLYPLVMGLLFLFHPFLLTIVLILLLKEPLDKENLQKKFFHQCLIGTPMNVFVYFSLSALSGGSTMFELMPEFLRIPVFILIPLTLVWYWIAESWYIHHYLGKNGLWGAALAFSSYLLSVFTFGVIGLVLTFLL